MSSFSVCWNRCRRVWRRHSERAPWQLEAILCERVLLEGRPQMRIVCRLARYLEDRQNDVVEREQFWSTAQRKLGRMSRLKQRDLWQIENLLAQRIPKATPAKPATIRPSANPAIGPHTPMQRALRVD